MWLIGAARANRALSLVALDSLAWIMAFYLATAFRLETWTVSADLYLNSDHGTVPLGGVLVLGSFAAVLHCLLAWVTRAHQGRSKFGSFEELFTLSILMGVVGVTASIVNVLLPQILLPRATGVAAAVLALIIAGWARATWRYVVSEPKGQADESGHPVLIVGAGDGARQLIDSMVRDPRAHLEARRHARRRPAHAPLAAPWRPGARHDRCVGRRGCGPSTGDHRRGDPQRQCRADGQDQRPRSTCSSRRQGASRASTSCWAASTSATFATSSREDFLGRHQVETDIDSIAGYLHGQARAGHRCRRLDRLGAVPADRATSARPS